MASPTLNYVPTTDVSAASTGVGKYLIYGTKWGGGGLGTGVTLTYSFPTGNASHSPDYSSANEWSGWSSLVSDERAAVRSALATLSSFINVTFVEVADNASTVGELRYAFSTTLGSTEAAHAYLPGDYTAAADVWFNPTYFNADTNKTIAKGSDDFHTILHETGHALGLIHPFEASPPIPAAQDNYFYSIMSYTASPSVDNGDSYASFSPTTPMYYDLVALEALYGRNTATNSGNTVYTFNDGVRYWQAINDGSGIDTIVYNGAENSSINLNPGTFSKLSESIFFSNGSSSRDTVTIGPGVVIENATGGSGNDVLTGNGVANVLTGNAGIDTLFGNGGNDTLNGGLGADKMSGGLGDDTYYVDVSGDTVTEALNSGIDRVLSSVTHTLAANVENLVLTGTAAINGTGNALANALTGNGAANVLTGLGGNDVLNGGLGADRMVGGDNNDTYVVDNAGDVVVEFAGGGIDTIQSSVSRTLSAEVENLVLTGTAAINGAGNGLANAITGNAAANVLNGGEGSDRLNGGGGSDTLTGGLGSDIFVFNTAPTASNIDRITDFNVVADTIHLENAIFTAIGAAGALVADLFWSSAAGVAHDPSDRLIYDTDSGWLTYDSNGSADGGAVHFATLAPGLTTLSAADFQVI